MTDDKLQSVRDDLAFMRALASEGQKTPLLGGAVLFGAGIIYGLASLAHWAAIKRYIDFGPWTLAIVWFGAMAAFVVLLVTVLRRIERKPGARSPSNRAAGAGWMGVGIAIFAMAMSYVAAAWKLRTDTVLMTFPSLIFALYGAGWAVAAEMTGKRWLWFVAIGSWVMAPLLGLMAGEANQFLAYAAALFLLMALPGFVILRAEPKDIV